MKKDGWVRLGTVGYGWVRLGTVGYGERSGDGGGTGRGRGRERKWMVRGQNRNFHCTHILILFTLK